MRRFKEQGLRKQPDIWREGLNLLSLAGAAQSDERLRRWDRVEDAPPYGAKRWPSIVLPDDGPNLKHEDKSPTALRRPPPRRR
jgi:hypothetical protein